MLPIKTMLQLVCIFDLNDVFVQEINLRQNDPVLPNFQFFCEFVILSSTRPGKLTKGLSDRQKVTPKRISRTWEKEIPLPVIDMWHEQPLDTWVCNRTILSRTDMKLNRHNTQEHYTSNTRAGIPE